ncbi:MAG TPA: HDIG domain-containing protein [Methanocorpusculum sp.]|nr:HDIG domain-containing protein [Methanocorpusculum sp.]
MEKSDALILLKEHVKKESLLGHCLATAAVMKGLAKELGTDEKTWELIGILHDIDFEEINEDMTKHGIAGYEILKCAGISDEIACPVRDHNHMVHTAPYTEKVDICLQTADSVSGLVIACAYVKGGNLSDVSVKTITKKYKTASFAAGCDRNRIASTDSLIARDRMYEIAIASLLEIKDELGLT